MVRKPKDKTPDGDEEPDEGLAPEEDDLGEAGFHVADGEEEDALEPENGEEKGLDSEEDVEYVRGPQKAGPWPGTKLLDDYEDHLDEEEDEDDEEDREEDDLEEQEDWDDEEDEEDDDED